MNVSPTGQMDQRSGPPPPTPFKISPEDQKIINECNREAFYQRCLPIGGAFALIAHLAIQSGYLRPNPQFGSIPKVIGAAFSGYFIGKLSYQPKCAEKLMAIPNSPLGAYLRSRNQQGSSGYGFDMPGYTMPGYAPAEPSQPQAYRDDSSPHTFTDLDTDRPYNAGLDDTYRYNLDSPQRPEDFVLPPQASTPNSYDELRRKNREEYERKMRAGYNRPPEEPQRVYQPPSTPPSAPEPFDRYRPTNIYGDIFEK